MTKLLSEEELRSELRRKIFNIQATSKVQDSHLERIRVEAADELVQLFHEQQRLAVEEAEIPFTAKQVELLLSVIFDRAITPMPANEHAQLNRISSKLHKWKKRLAQLQPKTEKEGA